MTEPISGKSVSVVEKEAFPKEIKFMPEKFRVIPFHALGTDKGILNGYEMDYLKIERKDGEINIDKPIIAISNESVSGRKKYQMILHPELLREREEYV